MGLTALICWWRGSKTSPHPGCSKKSECNSSNQIAESSRRRQIGNSASSCSETVRIKKLLDHREFSPPLTFPLHHPDEEDLQNPRAHSQLPGYDSPEQVPTAQDLRAGPSTGEIFVTFLRRTPRLQGFAPFSLVLT